jgi:transcriptional regulator with XRE-family HTH domain
MTVHDPAYKEFLVRLRQARMEAGLTQVQVAARLGKLQSYVSKCEVGDRRVDVVELAEFAELYEKPIAWFVAMEA